MRRMVVGVLVMMALGCTGDSAATDAAQNAATGGGVDGAEASTADGVEAPDAEAGVVVSQTADLIRAGARWVEDLRIGSLDDGPYALSGIWDLEVSAAGTIYAALYRVGEVREFSADGEFVRTIGKKGQGPQEFGAPRKLAFHPDGSLWVVDFYNKRYGIVDPANGDVVETHPRVLNGDCPIWSTGWFDPDGTRYDGEVTMLPPPPGERGMLLQCSVHRMSEDGTEREATLTMPAAIGRGGPYAPRGPFAFDRGTGTIWAGNNHEYRIARVSFDGDTLAVAQADVEQAAVTEEDLVRMTEEVNRALGGAGYEGRPVPRKGPEQKPFFSHMAVDDEGLLWVARVTAVDGKADRFDVFDRDGEWVGTVGLEVPVRVASAAGMQNDRYPLLLRGGFLYGVHEDELGIPYVVRWRLERSDG